MAHLSDDMYEYVAEVDADEIDIGSDLPPGLSDEPEDYAGDGDRDLLDFRTDTRYELRGDTITKADSWPNNLNGRTAIGCSGTIIYTDAVLTAGHCVHKGGYWRNVDFSPAQYSVRTNIPTRVKPNGSRISCSLTSRPSVRRSPVRYSRTLLVASIDAETA
jgi:hypothetical protein